MDIENNLIKTIAEPNLDVANEFLGLGIEELMKNDSISKLPIIGSVISLGKTAIAIRDWIFVRDILAFFRGLNLISPTKRKEWVDRLEENKDFRNKVGIEILTIINHIKDTDKNTIVGKLFGAYIMERIDYEDFLRLCEKLDRLFISDIRNLKNDSPINEDGRERYRSIGLYSVRYPGITKPENLAFSSNRELIPNSDCDSLVSVIKQN